MAKPENTNRELSFKKIFKTWWPLAASWFMMSIEYTALNAAIARLVNPEINLAAYGGIVYPLAIIIESPVIMLLSASTALSKDWASYKKTRTYMFWLAGAVTFIHVLVAFTHLYYFVTQTLISAPQEIIEPARIGLMIMTPWSGAIAYRRFNQGVMIRFGHSNAVAVGTVVRLLSNAAVIAASFFLGTISGVVTGALAQALGVTNEAIYVGLRVKPVLRHQVRPAPEVEPITLSGFTRFYLPLALTSLMTFIWQPVGSAAMSRMSFPIASLAVFPVVNSLIFNLRSLGVAYNEVVVALLDEKRAYQNLKKFAIYLASAGAAAALLIAFTPLSMFWFDRVAALPSELLQYARIGFILALPVVPLVTLQSWFQGIILHGRRTRGITESVAIFLLTAVVTLGAGVIWNQITGVFVGMAAYSLSSLAQTAWQWHRSRPVVDQILQRDGKLADQSTAVA